MGQVFAQNQRHGLSQIIGQVGHRAAKPVKLGLFFRSFSPLHLFNLAPVVVGTGAGLTAAQTVGRGIQRDPVEPRGEPRLGAKAAQFMRQAGADILRQILGIGAIAKGLERQPKDQIVMPVYQYLERLRIALNGGPDQILVACFHPHSVG